MTVDRSWNEMLRDQADFHYRQMFRHTLTPRGLREARNYPRIRAPLLLIWGEKDIALRKSLTQGLELYLEQLPTVRYLPEEGHFVPLEAPEKVAPLLVEHFLAGRPQEERKTRRPTGAEPHGEGPQPPA